MRQDDQPLVLVFAGYTKSRKSTLSRLLCAHTPFRHLEMSDLVRDNLKEAVGQVDIRGILAETNRIRDEAGPGALAAHLAAQIEADNGPYYVIAGLRSIADLLYLRSAFERVVLVYIHAPPSVRYGRLDSDPTSLARGIDDYRMLDLAGEAEGIRDIASFVDYFVVTDAGYPLTPLEQLASLIARLNSDMGVDIPWVYPYNTNRPIPTTQARFSTMVGYKIDILPTYDEDIPPGAPLVGRQLKSRGELANLSYDQGVNYIAYIEFPLDSIPRANHYHEEKVEQLYLISGKIRGYYRRANSPEAEVFEEVIEAGTLVTVEPGWIHAYVTIEAGHAIEFSSSGEEIIQKDKVRQPIVD